MISLPNSMKSLSTRSFLLLVQRVSRRGSSSWWIVYLTGPVLVTLLAVVLFPRIVYDQFIWQYLWGPVVADATDGPVIRNGVAAVPGYTLVNTLVYLGIVGYSLFGLRELFETLDLELDNRLAFALVPFLLAGGAMRAFADASVLGGYEVLFITPPIYAVVAGVAIGAIVVGHWISARVPLSVPGIVGTVGVVWVGGTFTQFKAEAPSSTNAGVPMVNRKHKRVGWGGSRQQSGQTTHTARSDIPTAAFTI